jgi:hypothetical protein
MAHPPQSSANPSAESDSAEDQPLEARLPPPIQATPADARVGEGGPISWWRPGWRDSLRYVGWRWLLLTPALGLVALYAASWYVFIPGTIMWMLQAKLLIFVVAVAISLVGYVARRAIRARGEPFCIYCGYNLSGLPDDYRCPECGRPYSWRLIAEYRRDPHWFIERWKMHDDHPAAPVVFDAGAVPRKRRARDGTE